RIIEDMQLRAVNVLFIDDNVMNLQEALHYVSGVQVAEPDVLADLLSLPQAKGKDDSALTRLQRYRVLETKVADRAGSTDSNEDFLRSCEIRVQLRDIGGDDRDRVLELVNRSNQLNFIKIRLSEMDLQAMLAEEARENRSVHVADRFVDFGIAGYYTLPVGCLRP